MAVKVMLAPAIAQAKANPKRRNQHGEPKPRRRRSSVYDADGNEVFITLMCLKCHKMRPLSQFGLRKMADGAIRNQPWCRTCRSGASAQAAGDARLQPEDGASGQIPEPELARAEKVLDSGTLAAQVVAALHGGRR